MSAARENSQTATASILALRVRHLQLLDRLAEEGAMDGPGIESTIAAVKSLINLTVESGKHLAAPTERREAQGILDYWVAELLTLSGGNELDASSRLAAFDKEHHVPVDDTQSNRTIETISARERERSRLVALARQWQSSNRQSGYLLNGAALEDAKQQGFDDDAIKQFLAASDLNEVAKISRDRNFLISAVAVLITLLVAVSVLAWRTEVRYAEAVAARTDAEKAKESADGEVARKDRALHDLQIEQQALREFRDKFDLSISFLARNVRDGRIEAEGIPPGLSLDVSAAVKALISTPPVTRAGGIPENFLGTALPSPIPKLQPEILADAYNNGELINYLNFALVLHRTRRIAIYSISAVDRRALADLAPAVGGFALDPQIPAKFQPDYAAFGGNDFDRGHLVTKAEIAWGPNFTDNPIEAAQRAVNAVNVLTNVTPQFDTFNQGQWSGLERWVKTQHNPQARQVIVISGPVLQNNDPEFGRLVAPRQFWKVAISLSPSDPSSLVVDAFLLQQFRGDTREKAPMATFDPSASRVTIAQIEQLTHLDFGPKIRAAGNSDQWAKLVADLNLSDNDARKQAYNALKNALVESGDVAKRQIAAALIANLQTFATLTQQGRYNVARLLSLVPSNTWQQPGWIDLRAGVRRAIGDLTAPIAGTPLALDEYLTNRFAAVKDQTGLDPNSEATVSFQFAGMTRKEAVDASRRLQAIGWKIDDEERTADAIGKGEVRYGAPSDLATAALLAADLRAVGLSAARNPTRLTVISPGALEIWVSR